MSSYSAKELIKILEEHGWYEVRQVGSHKQFKHPNKPNKITVPVTKVKKNIEMHILRQAGLKHLMRRRNTKPQPKRPQAPYKPPVITYGLTQTPEEIEAAKNTPCLLYTIDQLEKLATKKKPTNMNKEKNEMPTLGEIAKVTVTPPKPKMKYTECILDYLKDPIKGFNTTGLALANKIIQRYGLNCGAINLNSRISQLIASGKIVRKQVSRKGGKFAQYNFRLATKLDKTANDLTFVPKAQENAPTAVVEPSEPTVEPDKTVVEPVAQPAVSVQQTDGGVTISITLNLNLNFKG